VRAPCLPFFGHAYNGYLPHQSIIGISKLTRLVRLFAKRFTVQERLGEQIVNTFDAMLEPHGVALYLEAHHLCIKMRSVRDTSPLTQTMLWRGEHEHNASLRVEFLLAFGAER
jgi:GTP cyclohydrolase IA